VPLPPPAPPWVAGGFCSSPFKAQHQQLCQGKWSVSPAGGFPSLLAVSLGVPGYGPLSGGCACLSSYLQFGALPLRIAVFYDVLHVSSPQVPPSGQCAIGFPGEPQVCRVVSRAEFTPLGDTFPQLQQDFTTLFPAQEPQTPSAPRLAATVSWGPRSPVLTWSFWGFGVREVVSTLASSAVCTVSSSR
jgi:hypothetical protein